MSPPFPTESVPLNGQQYEIILSILFSRIIFKRGLDGDITVILTFTGFVKIKNMMSMDIFFLNS